MNALDSLFLIWCGIVVALGILLLFDLFERK